MVDWSMKGKGVFIVQLFFFLLEATVCLKISTMASNLVNNLFEKCAVDNNSTC